MKVHELVDIAITKDGEWEEDELLGLVMDACWNRCKQLNTDIANGVNTAWYDKQLLHESNLCQKVTDGKSMVDIYDSQGDISSKCLEGFEQWVDNIINAIVDGNRYKHYK